MKHNMSSNNTKGIAIILFLVCMVGLCWYFSNIIIYLFCALVLSLAGKPLVELLCKIKIKKFHFPRVLAAIITLCVLFTIIGGVIWLLIPIISNEIKTIASIDPQIIREGYNNALKSFESFAYKHNIDLTTQEISEALATTLYEHVEKIEFQYIFSDVANIIAGLFVSIFSIIFLTFFSLTDPHIIIDLAKKIFPTKWRSNFDNIVHDTGKQVSRYFAGVLIEMTIIGLINGLICHFLGVPNSASIGVTAGLLNIIPYIGPLIAVFINIIFSCTAMLPLMPENVELLHNALMILGTFFVAKLIDDFILQPIIYGKSVQEHPMVIFIVILAAAKLGGIAGMIFAVPLYTLLRIVVKEFFGQYYSNENYNDNDKVLTNERIQS